MSGVHTARERTVRARPRTSVHLGGQSARGAPYRAAISQVPAAPMSLSQAPEAEQVSKS